MRSEDAAPWFYRKRFALFGVLYGCAFFCGYMLTGVAGIPPIAAFRASGNPLLVVSLAVLSVVAGLALRVWASSYLSSTIVWSGAPQSKQLRVSGPYRFTRNPLYLGNILQALGIGLVTPWPVTVLVVAGVVAFDYALIFVEEPFLLATQGEAYARYCAAVPRLLPIPGKAAPAGAQPASLRDGLRTELTIGFFAFGMFAVMLVANEGLSHLNK